MCFAGAKLFLFVPLVHKTWSPCPNVLAARPDFLNLAQSRTASGSLRTTPPFFSRSVPHYGSVHLFPCCCSTFDMILFFSWFIIWYVCIRSVWDHVTGWFCLVKIFIPETYLWINFSVHPLLSGVMILIIFILQSFLTKLVMYIYFPKTIYSCEWFAFLSISYFDMIE